MRPKSKVPKCDECGNTSELPSYRIVQNPSGGYFLSTQIKKLHEFKSGFARPFRANCKRCGLKKQDTVHDLSWHKCKNCDYPNLIRIDVECPKCNTTIDWSDN